MSNIESRILNMEQALVKALKKILKARQISHAKYIAKEVLAQIGVDTDR